MFNIILHNPQIPPNTGNIVRLCANTGSKLHLIKPMGFKLDVKSYKRAGLDYHNFAEIFEHNDFDECKEKLKLKEFYAITKFGETCYSDANYKINDALLFGSEIDGLPDSLLKIVPLKRQLYIPMKKNSRSLNLSNAVSIVTYEAWKKINYKGSSH